MRCTARPVLQLRLKKDCKLCSAEAACNCLLLQTQALASHKGLLSVAIHQLTYVQACCTCHRILLDTCAGTLCVDDQMWWHAAMTQYDLINTCAGMLHVVPRTNKDMCRHFASQSTNLHFLSLGLIRGVNRQ